MHMPVFKYALIWHCNSANQNMRSIVVVILQNAIQYNFYLDTMWVAVCGVVYNQTSCQVKEVWCSSKCSIATHVCIISQDAIGHLWDFPPWRWWHGSLACAAWCCQWVASWARRAKCIITPWTHSCAEVFVQWSTGYLWKILTRAWFFKAQLS